MKFGPILCSHLFIAILQCSPIENAALKPVFSAQYQACLPPFVDIGRNNSMEILEAVVGLGFDNLQNVPTSLIFERSFSECKISSNQAFLYPDDVTLMPVNKIHLDYTATYFTRFEDYFKSTASSINLEFSKKDTFSISGSFGEKWQNAKRLIDLEQNVVFRTAPKYHEYTAILQMGSPLHANFKQALLAVAHAETDSYARYLAEMIVRNYGTHVIVKAYVGSIIEQEDFISLNYKNDKTLNEFKVAVSADFAVDIFGKEVWLSPSYDSTSVEGAREKLNTSRRYSQKKAIGGHSINKLIEGIAADMELDNKKISAKRIPNLIEESAILNQYGEPLYAVITRDHLSEIDSSSFEKLRSYLKDAIVKYYEHNKIEGCTDPSRANYDAMANFDDGKCAVPFSKYSFGGMFQICEIFDENWQKSEMKCSSDFPELLNRATGNYSCQDGFEQIKLYSDEFDIDGKKWIFFSTKTHYRRTTFWCRRKEKDNETMPSNSGFMFGGVFTNTMKNPYTQTSECPGNFQKLKLYLTKNINDWLVVCVSKDYQEDHQFQIPFGGFFSCQTPNEKCPDGYTQKSFITINCKIFYCVHSNSNSKSNMRLAEIRLPPFSQPDYEKNSTMRGYIDQLYNGEQGWKILLPISILISVIILALILLICLIICCKKNATIRTREHRTLL